MNYNIPYYGMFPATSAVTMPLRSASGGLFSKLLGGFNISSILSGTQKTLNLVNQTIPLVKQINPLVKNAKTMFRVMNEFKKVDTKPSTNNVKQDNQTINSTNKTKEVSSNVNTQSNNTEGPTFFI